MKLVKITFISLLAISIASCGNTTASADEQNADNATNETVVAAPASYAINTGSSKIEWQGDVIGIYFHSGTINVANGTLSTENGAITGGEFTVDMNSMVTTDSNYKKEGDNVKMLGHLTTDEFFFVDSFPTSNFKITSFENGVITGDLTIRGITHEEKVENVTFEEKDGMINASGKLVFGRRKYDIKWEHYLKDHTLSNDITLNLNISGKAS